MLKDYLIAFVVGCAIGAAAMFFLLPPKTNTVTVEKPVIHEKLTVERQTEIQYVAKAPGEKTDAEINIPQANVNVKVNNKEFTFSKLENEQYAFQKGKLLLNQQQTISLDIKMPEPPKHELGIGYGNHGIGAMYGQKITGNMGAWIYGDKNTASVGLKVSW